MGFRDILPPSLAEVVQDGLLDGIFEHALQPATLWNNIAEVKPWGANLGTESIMTRDGLLPVSTAPITGADPNPSTYGFEQYTVKMDQFGNTIDTNLAVSAMAMASKFIEDNQRLGVNAAQTLNALAQQTVYAAYGEGQTWVTAASTTSTALDVNDGGGFTQAVVMSSTTGSNDSEGIMGVAVPVLTPVSASAPLNVKINGVANTVIGVSFNSGNSGPATLTLGTAISASVGQDVINESGAVMVRPNGRATANDLVAGDIATLQTFQAAITRLRSMNVPGVAGAYTIHVHPQTLEELFQDSAFQRVYTGRADSPAYREFSLGSGQVGEVEFLGRFLGADWFSNTLVPVATNGNGLQYYRPLVAGDGALIKAPFEDQALEGLSIPTISEIQIINGVARVWRAPLDRLGQVIASSWKWTGGYAVGTDMLTGDSAVYKRAVVVEHA